MDPKAEPRRRVHGPRDRVLRDALDASMHETQVTVGMVSDLARELKNESTDDILV